MYAYSAIHKAKGWSASGLNGPFTACLAVITACKRSCGKVTFSQASVCLQGEGGEGSHVTITHSALSTYPASPRRGTYANPPPPPPTKRIRAPSLSPDIGPTPSLPGPRQTWHLGTYPLTPSPFPSPLDMVPSPLLASDGHNAGNLFKLVHLRTYPFPNWYGHLVAGIETCTVGKWVVRIMLECCLVTDHKGK